MVNILHFADAHIDITGYGRQDPESGLPLRSLDFLRSLDSITDFALQREEKVDLVLFAGDAYKDRHPTPTFQREWGRRLMRLSQAGILTVLLVGNHDISPAANRANTLQEFDTLAVPHIRVISRPTFLQTNDLEGQPLQIIAIPWLFRSSLIASLGLKGESNGFIDEVIENRFTDLINQWIEEADQNLPLILLGHGSIHGALFGKQSGIMLPSDFILPGSIVRDRRFSYVAMGHIHKAQDVNQGIHPPIIYPGSIERVDFAEIKDKKYFVTAEIEKKGSIIHWHEIPGRPFVDVFIHLSDDQEVMETIFERLPSQEKIESAMVRLILEYPKQMETQIDETALRQYTEKAFEFHFIRKPIMETRLRLSGDQAISSLTPLDLLDCYWQEMKTDEADIPGLQALAAEIIRSANND